MGKKNYIFDEMHLSFNRALLLPANSELHPAAELNVMDQRKNRSLQNVSGVADGGGGAVCIFLKSDSRAHFTQCLAREREVRRN